MKLITPKELFRAGELVAAKHLVKHGYEVFERNFRSPYGEIDIIACKEHTLAFVEVKTRKKHDLELTLANISYTKQKKISDTAHYYINQNPELCKLETRFDVIVVFHYQASDTYKVLHFEDAFLPVDSQ